MKEGCFLSEKHGSFSDRIIAAWLLRSAMILCISYTSLEAISTRLPGMTTNWLTILKNTIGLPRMIRQGEEVA